MRRAVGAVGVAAAALIAASVGACSGGAGGDDASRPGATLTTASSTTTTSTTAVLDPFAIPADPADIDEEYVQGVVDALYEAQSAAAEEILRLREVSPTAETVLEALYVGELLGVQLDGWNNLLNTPGRVETFRPGRNPLLHEVRDLITASDTCVFLTAERNYEGVLHDARPPQEIFIGLVEKEPGDDPMSLNPTPWMIFTDGIQLDPQAPPEDPCDAG